MQTERLFVTLKDRLITSKTVAEQQKLLRASQEKRHEDDLTKLNGELLRAQKIIKEKDGHCLNFEGDTIRIVQQVEAMRTDSIEDPTFLLSLVELKKEGQSLRWAVEESPHEIPATPVPESPLKKAAK
jgi:predicted Zn-ribbon and HTH transcriptional regulator